MPETETVPTTPSAPAKPRYRILVTEPPVCECCSRHVDETGQLDKVVSSLLSAPIEHKNLCNDCISAYLLLSPMDLSCAANRVRDEVLLRHGVYGGSANLTRGILGMIAEAKDTHGPVVMGEIDPTVGHGPMRPEVGLPLTADDLRHARFLADLKVQHVSEIDFAQLRPMVHTLCNEIERLQRDGRVERYERSDADTFREAYVILSPLFDEGGPLHGTLDAGGLTLVACLKVLAEEYVGLAARVEAADAAFVEMMERDEDFHDLMFEGLDGHVVENFVDEGVKTLLYDWKSKADFLRKHSGNKSDSMKDTYMLRHVCYHMKDLMTCDPEFAAHVGPDCDLAGQALPGLIAWYKRLRVENIDLKEKLAIACEEADEIVALKNQLEENRDGQVSAERLYKIGQLESEVVMLKDLVKAKDHNIDRIIINRDHMYKEYKAKYDALKMEYDNIKLEYDTGDDEDDDDEDEDEDEDEVDDDDDDDDDDEDEDEYEDATDWEQQYKDILVINRKINKERDGLVDVVDRLTSKLDEATRTIEVLEGQLKDRPDKDTAGYVEHVSEKMNALRALLDRALDENRKLSIGLTGTAVETMLIKNGELKRRIEEFERALAVEKQVSRDVAHMCVYVPEMAKAYADAWVAILPAFVGDDAMLEVEGETTMADRIRMLVSHAKGLEESSRFLSARNSGLNRHVDELIKGMNILKSDYANSRRKIDQLTGLLNRQGKLSDNDDTVLHMNKMIASRDAEIKRLAAENAALKAEIDSYPERSFDASKARPDQAKEDHDGR